MLHKILMFVTFYVFKDVNMVNTVFWNALVQFGVYIRKFRRKLLPLSWATLRTAAAFSYETTYGSI